MFTYNSKYIKNKMLFWLVIVLVINIIFVCSPQDSQGQFFGLWPGYSYAPGFNSGFSTGTTSNTFGYGLFGFTPSYSTGTQASAYGGFHPFGVTSQSYGFSSSLYPQTGQGAGISFSPSYGTGYNQTLGFSQNTGLGGYTGYTAPAAQSQSYGFPIATQSYGFPSPTQSYGFTSPTYSYGGGIQANNLSRYQLGTQGVTSFNPYSFGTGFTTAQNIWGLPSSGVTGSQTSQSGTNDIFVMQPVSQQGGGMQYAQNQILVQFKPGVTTEQQQAIHDRHGCHKISESEQGGFMVIGIPSNKTVEQMVSEYLQESDVLSAEPNYMRHSHFTPNDVYFRYQWHHTLLRSASAWDLGRGSGIKVAVLDSGVAYRTSGVYAQATDLAGTAFGIGYDFVNSDAYPDDDNGHGTHMAGCIAQTTNNYTGVAGMAFGATIIPVKIMAKDGSVTIANEVNGIYYAVNNGADIINMSLGGAGTSTLEEDAINYAVNNGVVVICSAGNAASSTPEYPASYTASISISAVRYDKTLARYSNYGAAIDFCSPGGDVTVDQNFDGYGDGILQQTNDGTTLNVFHYYFMEGTSPAAALASGVAALILGKNTTLTPSQVRTTLQNTATDLGTVGWDQYYGWGLVNPYNALLSTPVV